MSDNALDVDAYLASLERPTIKLGGETYTCEYPSFNERLQLEAQLEDIDWDDLDDQKEAVGLLADFFEVPADDLLDLPERALTEVVVYFLAIMRAANLEAEISEESASAPSPAASSTGSESSEPAA